MVTRKDFIDKLIEKIDKDIDEKLEEQLKDYNGEKHIRIFISLNPHFLNDNNVKDYIIDTVSLRGLYVVDIKASSDTIPKTMIEIML